jgi:GNAT superfamily N-acetyltransferase
MTDDLVVREASTDDRRYILALLSRTLGWHMDSHHEALFVWKHAHNVFGPSPAWVACIGGTLVAFRTFLRWEFEVAGTPIRAVRAVDTATAPEYRRHGAFRRLTLRALDELRANGAEFVFNTPNNQSRPGYLRMGWQVVGRVPLAVRPAARRGLVRMAMARVPAELWSVQSSAGEPAASVLEDSKSISELLASQPRSDAMVTRRSVEYLRWRYGFAPLDYRAVVLRDNAARGLALFRVRRRGSAHEAVLCDVLAREGDRAGGRRLAREVARTAGADYLLRVAGPRDACVPLPGQGPILTWRPVRNSLRPGHGDWGLTLGDVELF